MDFEINSFGGGPPPTNPDITYQAPSLAPPPTVEYSQPPPPAFTSPGDPVPTGVPSSIQNQPVGPAPLPGSMVRVMGGAPQAYNGQVRSHHLRPNYYMPSYRPVMRQPHYQQPLHQPPHSVSNNYIENMEQRQRKASYEIKEEHHEIEESPVKPAKRVKRLDFSAEIRELNIPEKKKDELLELDDRTRMLRIVNAFSEEQVDRYELFRRSCFPRNQIKRLMQQVSNTQVNQQVCIAMSGVAKVFVGELVEEALKVAEQRNHEGALLPSHIREAVRRLSQVEGSNCFDRARKRKRPF